MKKRQRGAGSQPAPLVVTQQSLAWPRPGRLGEAVVLVRRGDAPPFEMGAVGVIERVPLVSGPVPPRWASPWVIRFEPGPRGRLELGPQDFVLLEHFCQEDLPGINDID